MQNFNFGCFVVSEQKHGEKLKLHYQSISHPQLAHLRRWEREQSRWGTNTQDVYTVRTCTDAWLQWYNMPIHNTVCVVSVKLALLATVTSQVTTMLARQSSAGSRQTQTSVVLCLQECRTSKNSCAAVDNFGHRFTRCHSTLWHHLYTHYSSINLYYMLHASTQTNINLLCLLSV